MVDPDGVAGLIQWLKADALTGLANGDPVATWTASAGINATQGTAGSRPAYQTGVVNGLPVVRFTSDRMDIAGVAEVTNFTVITVAKTTTVTGLQTLIGRDASGYNDDFLLGIDPFEGLTTDQRYAAHMQRSVGSTHFNATDTTAPSTTDFEILVARYDGTTLELFRNSVAAPVGSVAVSGGKIAAGTWRVGGGQTGSTGRFWSGDIAEIAVYSAALSASDLASVVEGLAVKYGLAEPPAPPALAVDWLWIGGPRDDGATVVAKLTAAASSCRLAVSTSPGMTAPAYGPAATPDATGYVRMGITGLAARKRHWCQVEIDGTIDPATTGTFRTLPAPLAPASLVIDSGSCNLEGSTHRVWDNIRVHNPDVLFHLGDLHYRDISTNSPDTFRAGLNGNFASARMKQLARSVPWVYLWDDHDFGADNSNGSSASNPAANAVYRQMVPHLPLVEPTTGIYHAFGFGRVWFIATDLRSFRSPNSATDDASKTMLGATQKQWFKDQLVAARDAGYRMIVWLNTQVWVAETGVQTDLGSDTDHWGAFSTERAELAQFMADENVPQVVILSGDMHSCAYKLNADPAGVGGSGRIHVFQGAALDQSSNYRGVGWDQGPNGGGGRYGRLRVTDAPSGIMTVRWEAVQVDNTTGAHTVVFDTEFTISDSIKSQLLNGDSSLATVRSRWGSVQEYVKRPIESP